MAGFLRSVRAVGRLLRVLAHLVAGAWTLRFHFSHLSAPQQEARVQQWAQAMLRHMGIDLVVKGPRPPQGPVLLVANHISWLDIIVIHATRHCRFVSKSEIGAWPLLGRLATGAGTLYIERASRRDAMRVVHHMAERLQAGDVLAVFPEGTTGDGRSLLPFHANLLQAAIAVDAPVQPIGLHFVDRQTLATSFAPCYVGDDTLVQSLWRTLCAQDLCAVVHYGATQPVRGRDRRTLAEDLRQAIAVLRDRPDLQG